MKHLRINLFLPLCLLLVVSAGCSTQNYGDEHFRLHMASHGKDVMWVPSKAALVHEMLAMADVKPTDVVYDLGSGDGIIPIEASKKYGVRSVGIEYNPDLVELSIRNAKRNGVQDRVRFRQGDIFVEDFSEATVLTLYLGENLNLKLQPKIFQMRPGTRVISNTFRMGSCVPDREIRASTGEQALFWVVPARIEGDWEFSGLTTGPTVVLKIRQRHQFFDGRIEHPGRRAIVFEDGRLRGAEASFEFEDLDGRRRSVRGRFEGDAFKGAIDGNAGQQVKGEKAKRG
jgi:precorrin-6B methylase 2